MHSLLNRFLKGLFQMSHSSLLAVCLSVTVFASSAFAGVIRVPANQPTIQAGINAANKGDTVLVAPGTYGENIDFKGKAITVTSSKGAKVTIIDGGNVATVVVFASGETRTSVLSGFTIQNGITNVSSLVDGGGIFIANSSPTITNNIIQNNEACDGGGGVAVEFSSALVKGNIIRNNGACPNSAPDGAGIYILGTGSAQIIGNVIQNNVSTNSSTQVIAFGGGIMLNGGGSVLIENNLISGNSSYNAGGGIAMFNDVSSGTIVVQNLIMNNNSMSGSGVYWSSPPAVFADNTVTDGSASSDSTWSVDDFGSLVTVANNIIVASKGASNGLLCGFTDIVNPATFYNNDLYAPHGSAYAGLCTNQTGMRGNISANPGFVGTSNLRLKGGSPAIDAGNNSALDLPTKDFAGNPRIVNGNGGSTAIVDMGAYEFIPVVLAPKSLSFGLQGVGSSTSKTVKLTNAQNKVLKISSYSVPTGYSVSGCGTSVAAFTSCTLTVKFHPLTSGTFKGSLIVKDNAGNSPQTVSLSGSAR